MRGHESTAAWLRAVADWRLRKILGGYTIERFYRECLDRGDLAFDIGANHGRHTKAMLRCAARVVAVEPQAALAGELERRFPSASIVTAAVGREAGTATLATLASDDQVATLSGAWQEASGAAWDGAEAVAVVTLDELIARFGRPDLVKIDTEGYEAEALAALSVPVRDIFFEVHRAAPEIVEQCLEHLARLGDYELRLTEDYDLRPAKDARWRFSKPLSPDDLLRRLPQWGDVHARDRGRS
jgi:FkbM family methyltransferase